jgi:hypothetical protein
MRPHRPPSGFDWLTLPVAVGLFAGFPVPNKP